MKKTRKEKKEDKRKKELDELTTQVKDTPDAVAKKIVREVNSISDREYQQFKHAYRWNGYMMSKGKQLRRIIIGKAYEQAIVYACKQEYDFTVAILKILTELKPNLYFLHLALAYNLLELQQTQQAIDEFNIAKQLGSTRATQWLNDDHIARSCQAILQDITNQCNPHELVKKNKELNLKGTQQTLDIMRKTKLKPRENDHDYLLWRYRDHNLFSHVNLALDCCWPWNSALALNVAKQSIQNFDNEDIFEACHEQMAWCANYKEK
jgi:hypothetical protein